MNAQQLKNSILQMAVQGKLVPQDPNDEPASVLLERIRAEKEQMIKEGKIKKEKTPSYIFRGEDNLPYEKVGKNEPVCIADEVPFEIPDSWEWTRLDSVVIKEIKRGKSPKYADKSNVTVFAQKCNVKAGGIDISLAKKLDMSVFPKYPIDEYIIDGDIVVNSTGNGTLGRIGIFRDSDRINNDVIVPDSHVTVIRSSQEIIIEYILCVLEYYQPELEKQGEGSTNQTELKPAVLANLFIPLPPRNEQERIVITLTKLKKRITDYDNKEKSLSGLNREFPDLLKKSILQQAVMGKIVPQDPNDEPASIFLEKIRAEKDALIKAGKLKKDKHESIIYRRDNSHYEKIDGKEIYIEDEISFEIPESWEWVRLGSIIHYQNGYAYSKSDYSKNDKGIPVIKSNNLMTLHVTLNNKTNYIEAPTEKMLETQIYDNDLLMCLSSQSENTEPLGKTAIYDLGIPALLNQRVLKMTAYDLSIVEWLYYSINSEYFHYTVSHRSGGSAQSNLKLEHVLTMLVPIPPYKEQLRIIDAINNTFMKISAL